MLYSLLVILSNFYVNFVLFCLFVCVLLLVQKRVLPFGTSCELGPPAQSVSWFGFMFISCKPIAGPCNRLV